MSRPARKHRSPLPWDDLYELASSQAGLFTFSQAREIGFEKPRLSYHVDTGKLRREGHGIYRLAQFPTSEDEQLVGLWLWSKRDGIFSHETALALHKLSDVLPARIHMTVPAPWSERRIKVPSGLVLAFADVPKGERAWHGPVPVTAPLRTLRDCIQASVAPDLVEQALTQAEQRGLIRRSEARELRKHATGKAGSKR